MSRKIVLAIDFNNVVFASYYGQHLINSKGVNVNAVKGFFYKLKSLMDVFNPDYIVLANDLSREKTFRRKLYKPYKAQRKPVDEDIIKQMSYISTLVSLLGYPMINDEKYEADDILGMISRMAENQGMDTVIISSDKDLYQLITDHVYVMSPHNSEIIDSYWLKNNYKLTPDQWIELKMLQGDRSDNIPGVPGIGEVTALQLMQEYHSIDGIYQNLKSLKPKVKEALVNAKDDMELMRKLVTIITDYSLIGLTPDMLNLTEAYPKEIYLTLNDLEVYSLLNLFQYEIIPYNRGGAKDEKS